MSPFDALEGATDGLIALTAGGEGALARLLAEGQDDKARRLSRPARRRCSRTGSTSSSPAAAIRSRTRAEAALIELAYARDLPLVATNPAAYAEPELPRRARRDAVHRPFEPMSKATTASTLLARSLAQAGAGDGASCSPTCPRRSPTPRVVAQRCAFARAQAQADPAEPAGDDEDEQLRRDARAGLGRAAATGRRRRGRAGLSRPARVRARRHHRHGLRRLLPDRRRLHQMGQGATTFRSGPGRGSGAGSVVAWALTITDLDPIALGLLFERFLNPERVSMPDFDIDFCETRRGEVIRYVQQQIRPRQGRADHHLREAEGPRGAEGHRPRAADELRPGRPARQADPQPSDRSVDAGARARTASPSSPPNISNDAEVKRLFDLAMKLEGLPRHASTHAAGVVIGDRPLDELVPLYRDPRSDMPVTQFDMKYVEAAGLVKFDFLGLKTLSVLQGRPAAARRAAASRSISTALPWDDPAVYELLQRGDTVGVFQLESEGMRRTLAAVKPTSFGDIIALVSLYRPGPMDNIPLFGDRKNGREPIDYPHPMLEEVLEGDLRHLRLPGAGDAGGAGARRLHPRRGRPAAPRDGQEDPVARWTPSARASSTAAAVNDIAAGQGQRAVRLDRQVRRLRLQQEPRRRLCADRLPDRLAEGAPPGRILRRLDVLRHGTRPTSSPCSSTTCAAAGVECLPPDINASRGRVLGRGRRSGPLCARRAQGRRREGDGGAGRRARGATGRSPASRISPRGSTRACSTAARSRASPAAGAFDALDPTAPAVFAAAETILAHAASAADAARERAGRPVRRRAPPSVAPIRLPRDATWTLAAADGGRARGLRLLFLGPSGRPLPPSARRAQGARPSPSSARCRRRPTAAAAGAMMAGLVEDARWRTSAGAAAT